MEKFDCSKLVVPGEYHFESAYLHYDNEGIYQVYPFQGYEPIGGLSEVFEDIYYMVNEEKKTAMAVYTGNKKCGPCIPETLYSCNEKDYKVVLLYVVQRNYNVNVFLTKEIQDVYVDIFPANPQDPRRYECKACSFCFDGGDKSDFLETRFSSLYSKDHKRLIYFYGGRNCQDDRAYFKEIEEVYPGALHHFSGELFLPQVVKFDEACFGKVLNPDYVKKITFGIKLCELILRYTKLKNDINHKNTPLYINRDPDQIKIEYIGHPEYKGDEAGHIIFAATEPNKEDPCGKIVAFTLAGSEVKRGVGKGQSRGDGCKWKKTIYIHADDVAAINECECTCFHEHKGTEILLTGPCYCTIEHCTSPQYEKAITAIYVYENVNEVMAKLNKATWNERKFPIIK